MEPNLSKLNDAHFDLLKRLYGLAKDELLGMPIENAEALLFPEDTSSPLWEALEGFDDNYEPFPDTLIAEQIYDLLLPASIYCPANDT